MEILSPSTRSKDMIKKVDLYMESGIKECRIIDPDKKTVKIFTYRDYDLDTSDEFGAGQSAVSAESVVLEGQTLL